MEITHIAHCGVLIETPSCYLLFDYYKGPIPQIKQGKPLYIFVSHFHKDHFNPKIFGFKNAFFILSDDIKTAPENLNVKFVSAENTYELSETLKIKTLASTDIGVAYLVFCNNKVIYHAGDLNLWLWEGDGEDEKKEMESRFYKEIEKLKGYTIDIAFLSLDPRQKHFAPLGLSYFANNIKCINIFPIHFWGKYKYVSRAVLEEPLLSFSDIIIIPDKVNNKVQL